MQSKRRLSQMSASARTHANLQLGLIMVQARQTMSTHSLIIISELPKELAQKRDPRRAQRGGAGWARDVGVEWRKMGSLQTHPGADFEAKKKYTQIHGNTRGLRTRVFPTFAQVAVKIDVCSDPKFPSTLQIHGNTR